MKTRSDMGCCAGIAERRHVRQARDDELRRVVERAVLDRKGEVGLMDAADHHDGDYGGNGTPCLHKDGCAYGRTRWTTRTRAGVLAGGRGGIGPARQSP